MSRQNSLQTIIFALPYPPSSAEVTNFKTWNNFIHGQTYNTEMKTIIVM